MTWMYNAVIHESKLDGIEHNFNKKKQTTGEMADTSQDLCKTCSEHVIRNLFLA